jgi:hypothetical protein
VAPSQYACQIIEEPVNKAVKAKRVETGETLLPLLRALRLFLL